MPASPASFPATAAGLPHLAGSLSGCVTPSPADPSQPCASLSVTVCIIGGGVSGLCVASRLIASRGAAFLPSLLVLERESGIGGTWHAAAGYPGAACDIPSALYSLSFAQNADWSRRVAPAGEIRAYMQRVAAAAGLSPGSPSLRCGVHVDSAAWDAAAGAWRLAAHDVASGARLAVRARFLVSAVGALCVPAIPALPGLADFGGALLHSARWRADVPLAGRRVAVVGVGASAAQLVPPVAAQAAHLTVFQRTPSWIVPRRDHAVPAALRWLFAALPPLMWLYHALLFALLDANFYAVIRPIFCLRPLALLLARRHLRAQVPLGALREALTPRYEMGCKRILLSDDFYPALQRANVALVTASIERVTPRGVRTADGVEHAVDVLVLATGFDVVGSVAALDVRGARGATLRERLTRGAGESYLGVALADFPNLFLCLGPNTGLGHNSIIAMVECQTRLMLQLMARAEAAGPAAAVAPTAAAQRDAAERTQAALRGTVWSTCASWYNQQGGHNLAMWPWTVTAYWWATLWPNWSHYHLGSGVAERGDGEGEGAARRRKSE